MTSRFRMVAGPNGSGKTTLVGWLARDYAVNFYTMLNADAAINADRVARRYAQGGHDVPPEKIAARYERSLANVASALPYLSRAFFFDNSNAEMRYIASYDANAGFALHVPSTELPHWFKRNLT